MHKTCFIGVLLLTAMIALAGCKDANSQHASHAGHDHAGHDHSHEGHDHAGHHHDEKSDRASAEATGAKAQVKFVNVKCPVGNETINPKSSHTVTVEHEGVTYALCCADCIEPFKKEPAKYIAKLAPSADAKLQDAAKQMPAMQ